MCDGVFVDGIDGGVPPFLDGKLGLVHELFLRGMECAWRGEIEWSRESVWGLGVVGVS